MALRKYAAGFLEECESNGLPFLTTAANGNPPIVAFKAFGSFSPSMAYLEHVTISPTLGAGPRLKCNVITGSGPLFTRQNFETATSTTGGPYSAEGRFYITEESVGGYTHGLLADTQKGIYITYVILEDAGFDSYPISTYSLAPFCLEPELGAVAVDVNNNLLPTKPIWITEGYNYSLDYAAEDPVSVSFAVNPGAGAGLVPCNDAIEPDDVIRRINGQEANDKGEYGFQAESADCITVDSRYLPNGNPEIAVNAHCAPCCRCQDYKDTSEYIKGVVLRYYKAVKKLKELIAEYNSVSQQFRNRASCCPTFGSFTPRFRIWPQQNFKLQIQAMAENNTGHTIRASSMKLKHTVTAAYDMSATDENDNVYNIEKDQPLAVIPISEASYLYYKNLNPTSRGLQFSIQSQGTVETNVDLSVLSGLSSCQLEQPTDIPSCTGYLMMTSGVVIVDPIFRKIVNLNGSPGYIKITLTFTYYGSSPNPGESPCGAAQNRIIAENVVKTVAMSPNRKSVNPCPPATGSYVTVGSDRSLAIKFSDAVHGAGSLTLTYKTFVNNAWTTASETSVSLDLTGQFEASLGSIPAEYAGAVQVAVKYTPPAAGQPPAFVTKCKAADAADEEVDIPAEAFETATTLLL